jgi:hypothetical protein
MTNLERYLKNASRGTFGKTRALIRQELEANIRLRGKELEHHGLNESQAISRALEEIGAANLVSTGMTGVYTMPKITVAAIPAAFALTALVIGLSISRAEVETTTVGLAPDCNFATGKTPLSMPCDLEGNYLKVSSFKTELEKVGGTVEVIPEGFNLQFVGDLKFKVNGSPTGTPESQSLDFKRDGETFFNLPYVLGLIATQSNLPVKLEGLVNPRLTVGSTSIDFAGEAPIKTIMFRFVSLQTQLQNDLNLGLKFGTTRDCTNLALPRLFLCGIPSEKTHHIKVNDPQGTIYASLEKRVKGFSMDIAAVNANGILEMKLASQTTYFVNDFKKLKAGQGETILLRLTNRIDARAKQYEIAPLPAKLISSAN